MLIKKSYKILGQTYKIKFKDMEEYSGLCDSKDKTITLCYSTIKDPELFMWTLVHEMCHAMWHETGLNNTDISEDIQEVICDQFAKVVVKNILVDLFD